VLYIHGDHVGSAQPRQTQQITRRGLVHGLPHASYYFFQFVRVIAVVSVFTVLSMVLSWLLLPRNLRVRLQVKETMQGFRALRCSLGNKWVRLTSGGETSERWFRYEP
jgi:hypothetical protein